MRHDAEYREALDTSERPRSETLAAGNTPVRMIGLKLGRTLAAVRAKASAEGISLNPSNGTKK
jgi:hypothetical protein